MKRVISVITSLFMMVLLIGNAALPMSVLAASGDTKLSIEDTTVKFGDTKVSVPVLATSTDIAAMILHVKVTADDVTKTNPEISGATQGKYPDVMVSSANKGTNERNIIWNSPDVTATTYNNESIANITVQIPSDAVVGSTYTIEVVNYDVSTPEQEATYELADSSKLSAKITVVDENATEGYITRMEDKNVTAGTLVEVPMMVKCPVNLSAIIATYNVTGDAKITGFNYKNSDLPAGEFQSSQSKINKVLWGENSTGLGASFTPEKKFASVLVQIPDDAKVGDQYVLTLDEIDSPDVDQNNLIPAEFAKAVLTVVDEASTDGLKVTVTSKKISEKSLAEINNTVKLPVLVSYNTAEDGIASVRASFTVTGPDGKTAEITGVEKGSAIGTTGQFQTSMSNKAFALFNTENAVNQSFTADDDQQLFILTVVLPENAAAGDIYTVNSDFLDISNADQEDLTAVKVPGEIEIVKTPVSDIDLVIDKETCEPGDTILLPVHVSAQNLQALYGQFVLDSEDAVITGVKVTSGPNAAGVTPSVSLSNNTPGLVQWVSDQGPMNFDLEDSFISLEIKVSENADTQIIAVDFKFFDGAVAEGTEISDVNVNSIQQGQITVVKPD
ncbi:MAG: hypothetical protein Q4F95_15915, partial [Oscillospiraceae bacterium]|nr:hypothetical protein [Oscillospiraceae bacterium]